MRGQSKKARTPADCIAGLEEPRPAALAELISATARMPFVL